MNNDNNDPDKQSFPTIIPADISLTRETDDAGRRPAGSVRSPLNRRLSVLLLVLMAAVIGVVFYLPGWVGKPQPAEIGAGGTAADAKGAKGGSAPGRRPAGEPAAAATPWSDAQLAKLRKQSQDLLADMLEAQETLKEHHVREWAEEEYRQAVTTAERGDEAYQDGRFGEAVESYRQALDRFTALVDGMEQVYEEAMQRGRQALADGDAGAAAEQFERALLIRPGDAAAQRGRKRAGTLDEVNDLIAAGNAALEQQRLEAAKQQYTQALEIDPYADKAKQRLEEVEQRIRERDFRQAMSNGFTALEDNQLEQARQAFNRAGQLKPGSREAGEALKLVEERIKTGRINRHLEAARQAAAGEEWQTAVEHYRQALALDDSLAQARQGLHRAGERLDLQQRLARAINNPERLWDEGVRAQARRLLQEARAIQSAGPKLTRSVSALEQLLQKATTPVRVPLRSDNQTSVTIYKVGDMGRFEEKTVTLMPGRYVAVGKRPGYRDVRVEFTVRADERAEPVVIETREKINPGSG